MSHNAQSLSQQFQGYDQAKAELKRTLEQQGAKGIVTQIKPQKNGTLALIFNIFSGFDKLDLSALPTQIPHDAGHQMTDVQYVQGVYNDEPKRTHKFKKRLAQMREQNHSPDTLSPFFEENHQDERRQYESRRYRLKK